MLASAEFTKEKTVKVKTAGANQSRVQDDPDQQPSEDGARRFIAMAAAIALIIAACGLWLIPSEDSAARLIKFFVSFVMIAAGMFLLHGVGAKNPDPEIAVDPIKRELRVYEYDRHGNAMLKANYSLDELNELRVSDNKVQATDAHGVLILDMPIESPEAEQALRDVLQA
ncbi:MAG: hypothetical protein AAGF53_00420 [Pseudomonadota bacterium]